jgi:hypothetical protein
MKLSPNPFEGGYENRGFFKGLQGKLLVYFLLMSLIPLAVVATISHQKAKASLQETAIDMLGDTAKVVMGKVDLLIGNRFDDAKV